MHNHTTDQRDQKFKWSKQLRSRNAERLFKKLQTFEISLDPYIHEHQEDNAAGKNGEFESPVSPNNQNPRSSQKEETSLEDFKKELPDDSVHLQKYKSSRVAQFRAEYGLQNLQPEDSKTQQVQEEPGKKYLKDEGVQK